MKSKPSRVAAALALSAVVFTTSSCQRKEPLTATALRDKPWWAKVDLRLVDETHLVLTGAHLGGDDIVRGQVSRCSGASCEAARRDGGVPLDWVRTMATVELDETAAWAIGSLAVVGAAVALGVVVAASSKPSPPPPTSGSYSCPRMYSWNGKDWQLDSGTYGGSMFAVAPLTDHDLLEHLVPDDGKLRMRLLNELPETEHTDAITLKIVDHPAGTSVVPTASGKLLTFRDARPPRAATDLRGRGDGVLEAVSKRDDHEWTSDLSSRDPARPEDARDGLVLDFAKPKGARTAKLWVSARNTPWASDMLLYLLSRLGPALPAWFSQMNADRDTRARFSAFMAREGSLIVQVQTAKGWVARGAFSVAGPEILKDQALEIPVDDIPGDRLVVRLDAPVAFWSVDAVFAAFEENEPVEARDVLPAAAVADDGTDVRGALAAIDGTYYSTVKGSRAELTFDAPPGPRAGMSRSYVLVSTGYYVPDIPLDPRADPADFARLTADPEAASKRALEMLMAPPSGTR